MNSGRRLRSARAGTVDNRRLRHDRRHSSDQDALDLVERNGIGRTIMRYAPLPPVVAGDGADPWISKGVVDIRQAVLVATTNGVLTDSLIVGLLSSPRAIRQAPTRSRMPSRIARNSTGKVLGRGGQSSRCRQYIRTSSRTHRDQRRCAARKSSGACGCCRRSIRFGHDIHNAGASVARMLKGNCVRNV